MSTRSLWSLFQSKTASSADHPSAALLTRGLLVSAVLGTVYLFAQILLFAYGRDQGIYAVVADRLLHGGMPYRDVWDFKPPGIFLVYALTRAVFGSGEWAIRLIEVLGLSSMIFAFTRFARRFFGDARIGIVGGFFAVVVYAQLEFWHTAQPESFGAVVVTWAMLLSTSERANENEGHRKQIAAWFASGALYGFAGLLKPPLAGCAAVSAFFAGRALFRKGKPARAALVPFAAMTAGGASVVVLCAAWFGFRGALGDLYQTLFVFTPHYTRLSWEDATVPGMIYLAIEEWLLFFSSSNAAGIFAALLLPALATREKEGVLHVLGVVFVQLVGVALQGKFFPYHYGACLPLGGLLAGLGAFKVWRYAAARGPLGAAAFVLATIVVLEARSATRDTATEFWPRCLTRQAYLLTPPSRRDREALNGKLYSVADVSYDADRRVAELLHDRVAASAPVFIWGFEPIIYDMSGRKPASRYIYDVPQRVAWAKDETRRILMADLARDPPAAVVVEHRDVFPAVTGDAIDSAAVLDRFPELSSLLHERYRLETTIEDFDVYLATR